MDGWMNSICWAVVICRAEVVASHHMGRINTSSQTQSRGLRGALSVLRLSGFLDSVKPCSSTSVRRTKKGRHL